MIDILNDRKPTTMTNLGYYGHPVTLEEYRRVYQQIKDALGTDEDGEHLVNVAQDARRAEWRLAFTAGKDQTTTKVNKVDPEIVKALQLACDMFDDMANHGVFTFDPKDGGHWAYFVGPDVLPSLRRGLQKALNK